MLKGIVCFKKLTECLTTLDFSGAGPLTDLCVWDDGR